MEVNLNCSMHIECRCVFFAQFRKTVLLLMPIWCFSAAVALSLCCCCKNLTVAKNKGCQVRKFVYDAVVQYNFVNNDIKYIVQDKLRTKKVVRSIVVCSGSVVSSIPLLQSLTSNHFDLCHFKWVFPSVHV